jgi:hypothetical protein
MLSAIQDGDTLSSNPSAHACTWPIFACFIHTVYSSNAHGGGDVRLFEWAVIFYFASILHSAVPYLFTSLTMLLYYTTVICLTATSQSLDNLQSKKIDDT